MTFTASLTGPEWKNSKKENMIQDEREKDIRIHRDAFSGWGVVILGILIMILKLSTHNHLQILYPSYFVCPDSVLSMKEFTLEINGQGFSESSFFSFPFTFFINFVWGYFKWMIN